MINILKNIFGIHSIVICHKVNTNVEDIKNETLKLLKDINFKTFKVCTNRADKKFPIPSMEFNRVIGSHILKNIDCKVDVHNPDVFVNIEIRLFDENEYKAEVLVDGINKGEPLRMPLRKGFSFYPVED